MAKSRKRSPPLLRLDSLGTGKGLPALTVGAGRFLAEAAAVCLEDRGHASPAELEGRGIAAPLYRVEWPEVTEQMGRSFNDLQEATEYGACAVAILLVREITGLSVVERSRKGTGFDYWLGKAGSPPFQKKARLEVSGILDGTAGEIAGRMREKVEQTEQSDATRLPAYVVVVEFSRPCAEVARR